MKWVYKGKAKRGHLKCKTWRWAQETGQNIRKKLKSWGWVVPSSGLAGASWARFTNWVHLPVIKHWFHLPFAKILRSSSIGQNVEIVLNFRKKDVIIHVPKKLRLPFICPHIQDIEVVFHFLNFEVVFLIQNIEVVFYLPKYWSRLPFAKFWSCLPLS